MEKYELEDGEWWVEGIDETVLCPVPTNCDHNFEYGSDRDPNWCHELVDFCEEAKCPHKKDSQ